MAAALYALTLLSCAFFVSGNIRPREVSEPAPIDCQLSSWGTWSECDNCTQRKYRSRSIVKFGQFGGTRCLSSLGEFQRCKTQNPCEEEIINCGANFQCETGRCINKRFVCNGDNDCGDYSDEVCDDEPKPVCKAEIELSEIGRTAGNGINILGMSTRKNPFDNEYFNGICNRVLDGNTKTYYRVPWNAAALAYETKADKSFTTETFKTSAELLSKVITEKTSEIGGSLTFKLTPTEGNKKGDKEVDKKGDKEGDKEVEKEVEKEVKELNRSRRSVTVTGGVGVKKIDNDTITKLKELSNVENKQFMRITGTMQLATFQMRTRKYMLCNSFIEDINSLPSFYDKAEYFALLEMYGTHYTASGTLGGKYDLVYILDDTNLKSSELTTSEVKSCLGFNVGLDVTADAIKGNLNINGSKCEKVLKHNKDKVDKSGVIDNVVSLVEGGTIAVAAKLEAKLIQNKVVNIEDFMEWSSSLVDAPIITKQKPSPLHTLIPIDLKDAYVKSRNLERSVEDYISEHSTCKCQPCKNGGTVMVVDGECLCKCPDRFKGLACQTPKSGLFEDHSDVIDGSWGCWADSSSCINGEVSQTRQCDNPAPASGGKPCRGDSDRKVIC